MPRKGGGGFSLFLNPGAWNFSGYQKTLWKFQKVKMDEISLFGPHDNWPNVQVLFAHVGLQTTVFLNTHKNYRCKGITLKLSGMIALFILNLKN